VSTEEPHTWYHLCLPFTTMQSQANNASADSPAPTLTQSAAVQLPDARMPWTWPDLVLPGIQQASGRHFKTLS